MTDREIFSELAALLASGKPCCLVTVVETCGSTPRSAGAKMLVCADGTLFGSIGGGCGEKGARSAALRCLLKTRRPELLAISLADDPGTRGGDVCGGGMQVFAEPVWPTGRPGTKLREGD